MCTSITHLASLLLASDQAVTGQFTSVIGHVLLCNQRFLTAGRALRAAVVPPPLKLVDKGVWQFAQFTSSTTTVQCTSNLLSLSHTYIHTTYILTDTHTVCCGLGRGSSSPSQHQWVFRGTDTTGRLLTDCEWQSPPLAMEPRCDIRQHNMLLTTYTSFRRFSS